MSDGAPAEALTEGWQDEKRYDQRKYHYIRDTEALCGGLILYRGELTPGGLTLSTSKDDCAACKRKVERELASAATA